MADHESLAVFMDVTGCSYEEAFHRLASCGGHLGKAINRFYSIDAGPSGTTRSPPLPPPPPSPQLVSDSSSSEEEDDDDDYAPPAPAARPAERRGSAPRVSRWDSETRGGGGSSSRRRRLARRDDDTEVNANRSRGEQGRRDREDDDAPSSGGSRDAVGSRRRRPLDMFADSSSESEEKAEASSRSLRRRRRLNPINLSSDSDTEVESTNNGSRRLTRAGGNALALASGGGAKKSDGSGGSSSSIGPRRRRRFRESILSFHDDSDLEVDEPPPPPPKKKKKPKPEPENEEETMEGLLRVPRGLTYGGGFHAAKAHAARRGWWLLANVQGIDLHSLAQNRDVWGSDVVSGCVAEHFVLWQANADDARGGGKEEAEKVLCYYKVPGDKLPVVLVIDPVTGQAMDRLHGTDPNDFIVSIGPYTAMKPTLPIVLRAAPNKSSASAGAQSNRTPAASAPTSRQEQPPAAVRIPAEPVAAAAAAATAVAQQPAVCKMRVRLPDGRVVAKDFGSECAVAALFAYCRSELGGGAAAGKTLRLLRFVGASREVISNGDASFQSLGLNMSTVCVELG